MVEYICDKCHMSFKQKCHYTRHINRKFPCVKEVKSDNTKTDNRVTFDELKKRVEHDEIIKIYEDSKMSAKSAKPQENREKSENFDNIKNDEKINKEHKCPHCNRIFTKNYNLKIHIRSRCPILKSLLPPLCDLENGNIVDSIDIINNRISYLDSLKNIIEKKKGKDNNIIPSNTINNNITNNTTNNNNIDKSTNITNNIDNSTNINYVFNIGCEKIDLTKKEKINILNKGFDALTEYIKFINCDNNKPYNRNIMVTNLKSDYCKIKNNNKLSTKEMDKILDDLIDIRVNELEDIYNKSTGDEKRKIFKSMFVAVGKLINNINEKQEPVYTNNKKEIKLGLYNATKEVAN
jgi:uncharacterized C2H2 Zn-finger protein